MRVRLGQRRRDPLPPRRVDHRPGHVPAAAEDDVAASGRRGSARTRLGARPASSTARSCATPGPARQPRDPERIELVARLRDEPRLDPVRRAGEAHLHAASAERFARRRATASRDRPSRRPRSRTSAVTSTAIAASDVKEDPDRREHDYEAGAPVGHQGQRDSGQRRDPDDGRKIERGLPADQRRQARGEHLAERVAAAERDAQPRPGEARRTRRSRACRRRGRAPRR